MRGREKVKLSPVVQHILRFATADVTDLPKIPDLIA